MPARKQEQINGILKKHIQVDISRYDSFFVARIMQERINIQQMNSEESYLTYLEVNKTECISFSESLLVSHSEFFRNSYSFEVLQNVVLPDLAHRINRSENSGINIWSIACAAGQEVFSMSILIQEYLKRSKENFRYQIFGSDISDCQIDYAQTGIYPSLLLRNVNFGRLLEYFDRVGQNYKIHNKLRKNINFCKFDLLSEDYDYPPEIVFADFDIIFACNIFYYYKRNYQYKILEKINKCISKNGVVVTDSSEKDLFLHNGYVEIIKDSCVLRKI